jgi:hypothetical protein
LSLSLERGLGGGLDESGIDGDAFIYGDAVLIELVQKSAIELYHGFFGQPATKP